MGQEVSMDTRRELLEAMILRYQNGTKQDKGKILDEYVSLTGQHRKYAIRLLSGKGEADNNAACEVSQLKCRRRIYDEAVREAVYLFWEAADRICGKRLKAVLPNLMDAMERHGHLDLDAEVKTRLLKISASTLDRMLASAHAERKSRRRRSKPRTSTRIPVRTFDEWESPVPGYLEIDFVAHCGGSMSGSFIQTLVGTDISSQWTECVPLIARQQTLVVEGLELMMASAPFPILGIDSDNDGAFINETLLDFCKTRGIEFTRSRPYRKNDQAWVEQKNGAVIRRLVGHARFSGVVAGQALARLYQTARLYVNFFQPSFKLLTKEREGSKTRRTYDVPTTPSERLLAHPSVAEAAKETLRHMAKQLDPIQLLHDIRESQSALAALASVDPQADGPGRETLNQFLRQLPVLWKSGEVRPTHRNRSSKSRHWRTRKNAFEEVWLGVLQWLEREPDATAKHLFERLQNEYPGRFQDDQLRTFQRRVKEWRQVMARELLNACMVAGNGTTIKAIRPRTEGCDVETPASH